LLLYWPRYFSGWCWGRYPVIFIKNWFWKAPALWKQLLS